MLLTVFSRVMYLRNALGAQVQQYDAMLKFMYLRAADGWVANAREK